MVSYKNTKNAKYLFIMSALMALLRQGAITENEYLRAKRYYKKLTGADIILVK